MYFGQSKPPPDIAQRSLRGGAIAIGARAINAVVQVGSIVFLARLLSPEDYGLVSMVSAIIGIAPLLIDLGTRDAVIQQQAITPGEMSALFWMTLALGGAFAAIIAGISPLIAHFYGEPRLTAMAMIGSLSLVAMALSYQHQSLLRRAMRYRDLATIDVASGLISTAFAIVMAFRGWEYWALVTRPVIANTITAIGVWSRCRWLPGKPVFTTGVREMLRYGLHCIGFSSVDFVARFSDRVAIGYTQGATGLGYYQKACLVYENSLDLMVTPLHTAAMVGLSKLRHNRDELWRSWSRALSTVAFFVMPAFGILSVTSRDLLVILLGEKWMTASILLSVLALRGIPQVITRTVGWLHTAAGRSDRYMRWGLFAGAVHLIALAVGLDFGTMGVVVAYVASSFLLFVPAISYSGKPFGIGPSQVLRVVGPQMLGALIAVGTGFLLRGTVFAHLARLQRVALLVVSYMICYTTIVVGLFKVRTPLAVGQSLLKDLFMSS